MLARSSFWQIGLRQRRVPGGLPTEDFVVSGLVLTTAHNVSLTKTPVALEKPASILLYKQFVSSTAYCSPQIRLLLAWLLV